MRKKGFLLPALMSIALLGMVVTIPSCGGSTSVQSQKVTIVSLEVEGAKTEYYAGEKFSKVGITVYAVMSDGSKEEVTGWKIGNTKPLTADDTSIIISYEDVEVSIPITVTINPITALNVDVTSMSLQVNEKKQITATVLPEGASIKDVTYASSDANVVTVDKDGLATATGIGSATITVTTVGKAADGNSISKTISVTVNPTAVTGLDIDADDVTLKVGEEKQIGVTILPVNATDKAVSYSSSDATVASVSDSGLVKALKEGTTTITVSTHATGNNGQPFRQSFVVDVVDVNTKYLVAFRNTDGTLIQGYREGTLSAGEIPAFTRQAPRKASDAEGVYIFRGFDKEIVPYVSSTEEVTYTAVYEKRQYTITGVSLALEGEQLIYSVTGTSVAANPSVDLRSMIKGGDWSTTTLEQIGKLSYNPDGSWVVKADLLSSGNSFLKDHLGTEYIGKFKFNNGGDEDLKVLIRNDAKRYRHTLAGEVIEIKDLSNDWDGVTGYDSLSEEFKAAIPAPTWDGLNIDFKETTIAVDGIEYKLFANEDTWNCVSLIAKKEGSVDVTVTPNKAELENINNKPYYVVTGSYKGDVTLDELHKAYGINFQRHSDLNGDGDWGYLEFGGSRKYSFDKTVSSIDTVNKTYVAKFLIDIDNYHEFVEKVPYVFIIHTHLNDAEVDNMKIAAGETSFTIGSYKYSILKNSATWTIACLQIEAAE